MTRIYAHRGASAEFPENTLPAFARAIELGAHGIELDVHLTGDGVPVVIHDARVDRTTNGSGTVSGFSHADIGALDAGNGARIPTLREVLDLVGKELHVDIEVKASGAADAVLHATAMRPWLRFAISSFDHDVLRYVRRHDSGIDVWPLSEGASDDAITAAVEVSASCLALHEGFVNGEIVDELRTRGIDTWVWTVNDPARANELRELAVMGICTDDPASILAALVG